MIDQKTNPDPRHSEQHEGNPLKGFVHRRKLLVGLSTGAVVLTVGSGGLILTEKGREITKGGLKLPQELLNMAIRAGEEKFKQGLRSVVSAALKTIGSDSNDLLQLISGVETAKSLFQQIITPVGHFLLSIPKLNLSVFIGTLRGIEYLEKGIHNGIPVVTSLISMVENTHSFLTTAPKSAADYLGSTLADPPLEYLRNLHAFLAPESPQVSIDAQEYNSRRNFLKASFTAPGFRQGADFSACLADPSLNEEARGILLETMRQGERNASKQFQAIKGTLDQLPYYSLAVELFESGFALVGFAAPVARNIASLPIGIVSTIVDAVGACSVDLGTAIGSWGGMAQDPNASSTDQADKRAAFRKDLEDTSIKQSSLSLKGAAIILKDLSTLDLKSSPSAEL